MAPSLSFFYNRCRSSIAQMKADSKNLPEGLIDLVNQFELLVKVSELQERAVRAYAEADVHAYQSALFPAQLALNVIERVNEEIIRTESKSSESR